MSLHINFHSKYYIICLVFWKEIKHFIYRSVLRVVFSPLYKLVWPVHRASDDDEWPIPDPASLMAAHLHCTSYTTLPHQIETAKTEKHRPTISPLHHYLKWFIIILIKAFYMFWELQLKWLRNVVPAQISDGRQQTWQGWCCVHQGQRQSSSTPDRAECWSVWSAESRSDQPPTAGTPLTWCGLCSHMHSGKCEIRNHCNVWRREQ